MSAHAHLNGLLPINKPSGMISKDVSRWLVKRLGRVKLGHVGTLDPGASGVLPLLLGRATRLQDYLLEMPKTYEFDISFGSETDTLDSDGEVIRQKPWEHITEKGLLAAITCFIGDLEQTPPIFSAIKYKGKPLYEYARSSRGDDVPLEALKRHVRVSHFELQSYANGVGSFKVTCSRGTYVRSLVRDVAEKMESCGTLTRLVRTEAAGLTIDQSYDLETIEQRLTEFSTLLVPMGDINLGMPRWRTLEAPWETRLRSGQELVVDENSFVAGLDPNSNEVQLQAWARPFLLLDRHSDVLGMGSARRHEPGRISINMKRGL